MSRPARLSRRDVLKGSGLLVVGFSLAGCNSRADTTAQTASRQPAPAPTRTASTPATAVARSVVEQAPGPVPTPAPLAAPPATALPTAVARTAPPRLSAPPAERRRGTGAANTIDSWLVIGRDESVTVFSGKVELGTGVRTALAQLVAEELDVPMARIRLEMGDTDRTPDQGYTAGSKTIQGAGVALRQASAEARLALLELAAATLRARTEQLQIEAGVIMFQGDPSRRASYGELIGDRRFERQATGRAPTKHPEQHTVVGTSVPRVDLPGKLTGAASFVHDVRLEGMLHGRVIRPSGVGATLASVDEGSVAGLPGLVKVVRQGSFLGVVAEREEQAIQAARTLAATWTGGGGLPAFETLHEQLRGQSQGDGESATRVAATRLSATYTWPYQIHASLGPSCAVADVRPDGATIWSATQGVYQLRGALAQLLGMTAEQVRVIHAEGSGCYGHNGADDAAADAALLSRAVGRPVRVQWSRQDEHAWAPHGPAMRMELHGGLDAGGTVVAWDFSVWTPSHSSRPGGPANLLAGQLVNGGGGSGRSGGGGGGGERNARHDYTFPNNRVRGLAPGVSPLRTSAFRGLGAPANAFANESFVDELAAAAGADPVAFRLRHLADPRSVAVIQAAAERFGWPSRHSPAPDGADPALGRGVAFSRYENANAYVAACAEVEVDRASGAVRVRRLVAAHDCGLIVNPDGLANQVEGNMIQATSRALKEQVTFDEAQVTSVDWRGYPILTFAEVPDVEVVLLNRPDQPPVGAGEPATLPVAPAIANAIFDATGARVRSVPLTPERIKAARG
jgi:CO/xanthine dehydrogenase Mo-binding subunit